MLANVAFLAAVTVFLLCAWLAGELVFLAPYRRLLFSRYGWLIGALVLLTFVNVCATYYSVARWLFTRDTGRKLSRLDDQLSKPDSPLEDLRDQLATEDNEP